VTSPRFEAARRALSRQVEAPLTPASHTEARVAAKQVGPYNRAVASVPPLQPVALPDSQS
jgi:hypothetical protein